MVRATGGSVYLKLVQDELKGAAALLQAQTLAGLDKSTVLESMFTSTLAKLQQVKDPSHSECIELIELSNEGPWSAEQKKELAQAVGSRVQGVLAASPLKAKNQTCIYFENMMPEWAWAEVRSRKTSMLARAQTIAHVAVSINLINPSQPTLFRMTAILAYGDQTNWDFTQEDVFGYMDKIKGFIKSGNKKKTASPYIVDYPTSASDLPEGLLKLAFPDGDVPVDVTIPELDSILAGKKQRGRNIADLQWLKHVPEQYRELVIAQVKKHDSAGSSRDHHAPTLPMHGHTHGESDMPLADAVQRLRQELKPLTPASASQFSSAASIYAGGLSPRPHIAPAALSGAPLKAEPLDEHAEPAAAVTPLEEMERAMRNAGVARAKAKGPKKAALQKKPAKLTIQKKPAAKDEPLPKAVIALGAKIDMKDVFEKLRKARREPTMYKGKFASRAYGAARKRALDSGASDINAKKFASTQYQKAAELWGQ